MNTRLVVAFLAAASLSGCVVSTGGGGGGGGGGGSYQRPGDVTFLWTFDGGTCDDFPDIQAINVSIAGEPPAGGQNFPCSAGAVLQAFAAGSYNYTIEALGYGGETLFATSGIFTVNGNISVSVDLQSVAGPHSYAYMRWTFPPNHVSQNPTCADARVSQVQVRIDNGTWVSYPCAGGNSSWQLTGGLDAGLHTLDVRVLGTDGTLYFSGGGTFTTWVGFTDYYEFPLAWEVGVLGVRAQLWNGTSTVSCTSALIERLYVDMQEPAPWLNWIDDLTGQPCDPQWTYNYRYVPAGTYAVVVSDGAYPPFYSSQMFTSVTIATGEYTLLSADVDKVR